MRDKTLIIFDLDGVLVELRDDHFQNLNKALQKMDYPVISEDSHYKEYNGLSTRQKLEKMNIPVEDRKIIYDLKQKYTIDTIMHLKHDVKLQKVLKKLKEDGYILMCASNAIRATVKNALLYTGLLQYIDYFMSNEDVIHPKPNPEIYLRCMIAAGVGPKDTWIIEDSGIGIEAAQQSGAHLKIINNPNEVTYELLS